MKTLQECTWKEFALNEVFNIKATRSGIDRNKLIAGKGNTPYITRSDANNGWDSFICEQPNYSKDNGNVLSIGLDTQTVFYQPCSFYTGQNIQVLSNPQLNKYVAAFIIPLLKIQLQKFNWGGNGATLGRLKRSKLLFPVTPDGTPDWQYMEDYMRAVEHKLLAQALPILQEKVKECNNLLKGGGKLDKQNWSEFAINEIFSISSGVRLTAANMHSGNTPFIGASDSNNGITEWVNNRNDSVDKDVLGVNYNGSVCESFYHPYQCLFSDDVKRLHCKQQLSANSSKYIYLFLKQAILQQKVKYTYGYKFNAQRMSRQIILLPVTQDGTPDYTYMENYMRSLEAQQIQRYLAYKS